ncbi:hypothetical protein [Streptacidiphilus sp. PAMC 29251]
MRQFKGAPSAGGRAVLVLRPTAMLWCDCHLFAVVRLGAVVGHDVDVGTYSRAREPLPQDQDLETGAGTRCPPSISGVDRVHLAMVLLGDHSADTVSAGPPVPEEDLTLRLLHELRLLFEPCQDLVATRTWLPQPSPAGDGGIG